jgi:ankyrin repeat protein
VNVLAPFAGSVWQRSAISQVWFDMKSVNLKLLIALGAVLLLALGLKLANPDKKYSTQQFWESATVSTVTSVPEKALKPGNKNGSVLMWAAIGAKDPAILEALVARGTDVNESDVLFGGTPMTGAAGKNDEPAMIEVLVKLGADVNKRVNNGETAAMVAAQYNTAGGIIEALNAAGADLGAKNDQGKTALDLAREHGNATAEKALLAL